MSLLMRTIYPLARAIESIVVGRLRADNRYPPLFVVGAPRSGTTVVIQHIINSYDFGYFPNLAKEHPRACVTFGYWARRKYEFQASYESAYGVVAGPMAPSDGWDIFHRWFPRYDHSQPVREERLHELKTIVRGFERIFNAPFANKNNANSLRIAPLRRLFPDARFVHVRRDLCDTVQSVLKSRTAHGVPANEWWGIAPPRFFDRAFTSELERVVYQTYDVEKSISENLADLAPESCFTTSYEDFCDDPAPLVGWLASTYADAGVKLRARGLGRSGSFRGSSLAGEERARLEAQVDKIVERLEEEYR